MGKTAVGGYNVQMDVEATRKLNPGIMFESTARGTNDCRLDRLEAGVCFAFAYILGVMKQNFGVGGRSDPNFADTPLRVARAYREIFSGLGNAEQSATELLSRTFPGTSSEMLTCGPVHVWSMCPHHFLPVEMDVWVAYLPSKKLLGLSKLSRLAQVLAARPMMQEQVTSDIADRLFRSKDLRPLGSACHIRGRHLCMAMRGAKQDRAQFSSTAIRGAFKKPEVKAEFLEACRG